MPVDAEREGQGHPGSTPGTSTNYRLNPLDSGVFAYEAKYRAFPPRAPVQPALDVSHPVDF